MRRYLAILGALAIVLSLPGAAAAGRATRYTDHATGFFCEGLEATSGGGFTFLGVSLSERFGPDASIDYWSGAPDGPPDLVRDWESPVSITWDGTSMSGSIPLATFDGTPAGSATFSATLVPVGDPESFDDRFRDGNRWQQFSGTTQPMDVSGSLIIAGSTFSLDPCFGDDTTYSVFETAPNAFVAHFSDRSTSCELSNADGDTGFLFASLADDGSVFVDAGAFPMDGSAGTGAFGFGTFVDGVIDATLDTYDFETGEPTGGTGSLHLEIVGVGEPIDYLLRAATARVQVRGVSFDLEGSLELDGMTFDLGACVGVDADSKIIATNPRGPKPGGKVPSNDLPSGARLIGPGDRTSVATKGASPEREASFECLTFEDGDDGQVFEIPVGHTVWYRVQGTGGSITVDTAGSDYDTVIAVYTSDGAGGFTPVPDACVDDVPIVPVGRTLQAAVTWPTVAGTTYYVQIGGFPDSFTYGNLRVAVSS